MREQALFDPARLVFIDETSTNTAMVRLRGRAPRGERLIDYAPHRSRQRPVTLPPGRLRLSTNPTSTGFCCKCSPQMAQKSPAALIHPLIF